MKIFPGKVLCGPFDMKEHCRRLEGVGRTGLSLSIKVDSIKV